MMMLISGGNGSGKSAFAEQLISAAAGPRYYVATMAPETPDNRQRIEKHRRQRAGLDFVTVEEPCDVGSAPVAADAVVLLEDVSNLLGSWLFVRKGTREQTLEEILTLSRRCRHLLVVTISGLCADDYDGETAEYIHALNWLNTQLFDCADAAVTLAEGKPVWHKGEEHDLF